MATNLKKIVELIIKGDSRSAETSMSKLGKGMSGLQKAAVALGSALAIGRVASDFVRINTEFQRLKASLETVTGSSAAADQAFANLTEFAKSTPYQLEQVVAAFTKLQAMGLDPSMESLKAYGNTASAMGKDLNQMIEAVADAATGEFERLKEFGIKARQQGDSVTFTFRGVSTTVKKEAGQIEDYLRRIGQVEFAGGMDRQMDTLGGALSNLSDAYSQLLYQAGEASGSSDTLKDSIQTLSATISDPNFANAVANMASGFAKIANAALAMTANINDAVSVTARWAAAYSVGDISFLEWATTGNDAAAKRLQEIENSRLPSSVTFEPPPRPKDPAAASGLNKNQTGIGDKRDASAAESLADANFQARIAGMDAQAKQAEALRQSLEAIRIEQLGWAKDVTDSLRTPIEVIQDYRQQLDAALERGDLTLEQHAQAYQRFADDVLDVNMGGGYWDKWLESAERAFTDFDQLTANVAENISSNMGGALEKVVFDSTSVRDAVANMAEGMARSTINALGEMGGQWLIYQLVQKGAQTTAQASAAATMTANAQAQSVMAGLAAYASTAAIPITGPAMAPAAMAAAIAATEPLAASISAMMMAGMAHDGIDKVPQTGTWLLQKGERVTTEKTSARLDQTLANIERNQGRGNNPDGGGQMIVNHWNIQALDGHSVRRLLMENSDAVAAAQSRSRSNNVRGTR